jgi:hypothetical protein
MPAPKTGYKLLAGEPAPDKVRKLVQRRGTAEDLEAFQKFRGICFQQYGVSYIIKRVFPDELGRILFEAWRQDYEGPTDEEPQGAPAPR